jgi:hypothetical protein
LVNKFNRRRRIIQLRSTYTLNKGVIMKAWFKTLGVAIVGTIIAAIAAVTGGCGSVMTCSLTAPAAPVVVAPAVPVVQYPVIQVVDADGIPTAEIIDNGVTVTPVK